MSNVLVILSQKFKWTCLLNILEFNVAVPLLYNSAGLGLAVNWVAAYQRVFPWWCVCHGDVYAVVVCLPWRCISRGGVYAMVVCMPWWYVCRGGVFAVCILFLLSVTTKPLDSCLVTISNICPLTSHRIMQNGVVVLI